MLLVAITCAYFLIICPNQCVESPTATRSGTISATRSGTKMGVPDDGSNNCDIVCNGTWTGTWTVNGVIVVPSSWTGIWSGVNSNWAGTWSGATSGEGTFTGTWTGYMWSDSETSTKQIGATGTWNGTWTGMIIHGYRDGGDVDGVVRGFGTWDGTWSRSVPTIAPLTITWTGDFTGFGQWTGVWANPDYTGLFTGKWVGTMIGNGSYTQNGTPFLGDFFGAGTWTGTWDGTLNKTCPLQPPGFSGPCPHSGGTCTPACYEWSKYTCTEFPCQGSARECRDCVSVSDPFSREYVYPKQWCIPGYTSCMHPMHVDVPTQANTLTCVNGTSPTCQFLSPSTSE